MIRIIKLLFLELLFIFTLIIVLPSFLVKEKYIINDESISILEPLISDKDYTQAIPNSLSLNSVSIMIKNPNIKNNSQIFIDLLDQKQNKLNEFTIYGSNVGDPSWVKLKFNPIPENNLSLKISTENKDRDSLQIYYKNNRFNLQATTKNSSFISRLKENIFYQSSQFTHRSYIFSLSYLGLILLLSYLYVKKK